MLPDPPCPRLLEGDRDKAPFDDEWREAMRTVVKTFKEQQRKTGNGPYRFHRNDQMLPYGGYGAPTKTSADDAEIMQSLTTLRDTTDGTGLIHESFNKNNPGDFTRSYFAWANSLFGELVLDILKRKPKLLVT